MSAGKSVTKKTTITVNGHGGTVAVRHVARVLREHGRKATAHGRNLVLTSGPWHTCVLALTDVNGVADLARELLRIYNTEQMKDLRW